MEFLYGDVSMETLVCTNTAQAEVEGELPLPEGRRASDTEVLSASATVLISRCAAAEGAVVIEGRVRAELVCRDVSFVPEEGEGVSGALFAFSSSAAFRYVMDAPGAKEGMAAEAQASILEMNVVEGGRLTFVSTVELYAAVTSEKPVRALSGVRGTEAEFKEARYSSFEETMIACEEMRVREELAARGVCRVLCASAQACVRAIKAGGDTALIEATAHVAALVETESARAETFAAQVPLTLEVALDERPRGQAEAEIAVLGTELYVLGEGTLCLELHLRVKVYDVCPREAALPADAYVPGAAVQSVRGEAALMLRGGRVQCRCGVDEKLVLPEAAPQPTRAVWCAARPLVTSANAAAGVLCVEGILFVRAVYETAECTPFAQSAQLPFACEAPCPNWCCAARAEAKILAAGITLSGGTPVFSAALEITAAPYCEKNVRFVTGLEEAAPPEGRRSLILCYAGAGETLFDVGRRYGLSRATLTAANPGAKEELSEGERLVFIGRA